MPVVDSAARIAAQDCRCLRPVATNSLGPCLQGSDRAVGGVPLRTWRRLPGSRRERRRRNDRPGLDSGGTRLFGRRLCLGVGRSGLGRNRNLSSKSSSVFWRSSTLSNRLVTGVCLIYVSCVWPISRSFDLLLYHACFRRLTSRWFHGLQAASCIYQHIIRDARITAFRLSFRLIRSNLFLDFSTRDVLALTRGDCGLLVLCLFRSCISRRSFPIIERVALSFCRLDRLLRPRFGDRSLGLGRIWQDAILRRHLAAGAWKWNALGFRRQRRKTPECRGNRPCAPCRKRSLFGVGRVDVAGFVDIVAFWYALTNVDDTKN